MLSLEWLFSLCAGSRTEDEIVEGEVMEQINKSKETNCQGQMAITEKLNKWNEKWNENEKLKYAIAKLLASSLKLL